MEKYLYNVNLEWNGERKGKLSSPELPVAIEVATPPEFDKGIPEIWSPEHLYTAAVVSCYMTTFLAIAEYSNLSFVKFSCTAEGVLEKVDGKFLMTEVILRPILTITNEADHPKSLRILQKAEAACLITNSITARVVPQYTVRMA
jgi:peroxiredoxin-like protein